MSKIAPKKEKKANVDIIFTDDDEDNDGEPDEEISEVLSIAARIKKRQSIRRFKTRLRNTRKRALKRRANNSTITKRARRSAIRNMKKRFSGGKSPNKLGFAQKIRVEKLVSKRKNAVTRSTRKLLNTKRRQDRTRLINRARR